MRISELVAASGIPLPTVKFYLREGLLAPGAPTAANLAEYDDSHLRRLRLIRALTDTGGLRLREVRTVLEAIDNQALPLHELLGVAHYALEGEAREGPEPGPADMRAVDRVLETLGWSVDPSSPARRSLAAALATLGRLGWDVSAEGVAAYGRAVDALAAAEVASIAPLGQRAQAVERLVVGTVVFEAILLALRRLAQEHHSGRLFSAGPGDGPKPLPGERAEPG